MLPNQMRFVWMMTANVATRRCRAGSAEATRTNPTNERFASTPERFWSSSRVHRAEQRLRRCREISVSAAASLIAAAAFWLAPIAVWAATATPHPARAQAPARVDITKIQPKALLPKRREHQEYVVEINKFGQVARVRSQHGDGDPTFNAQTYGNALQAFIRTPDGHVVVGTYRLTYDFDPKTARVRRDVTLLRQGGVNQDAQGAALDLLSKVHSHTPIPIAPGSSIDPRSLPDLNRVMEPTPSPSPH